MKWSSPSARLRSLSMVMIALSLASCSKSLVVSSEVADEVAQQIGDFMASVDEVGGPSGTLSQTERSFLNLENRLDPLPLWNRSRFSPLFSEARAASCISLANPTFSDCDIGNRQIIRTFNSCTLGLATFTGSVRFTWAGSGSGCSLFGLNTGSGGGSITRVPDFSVSGLRGATLKVGLASTAVVGQRLTHVSGIGNAALFRFSSDGIRRTFTNSDGSSLADFTTSTSSDLQIQGAARNDSRVITGGTLHVINNRSGVSCDFTPDQVRWSATCNCPVSGAWTARCSDGAESSLRLSGCGTADLTLAGESQTITFDRCFGI